MSRSLSKAMLNMLRWVIIGSLFFLLTPKTKCWFLIKGRILFNGLNFVLKPWFFFPILLYFYWKDGLVDPYSYAFLGILGKGGLFLSCLMLLVSLLVLAKTLSSTWKVNLLGFVLMLISLSLFRVASLLLKKVSLPGSLSFTKACMKFACSVGGGGHTNLSLVLISLCPRKMRSLLSNLMLKVFSLLTNPSTIRPPLTTTPLIPSSLLTPKRECLLIRLLKFLNMILLKPCLIMLKLLLLVQLLLFLAIFHPILNSLLTPLQSMLRALFYVILLLLSP